MTDNKDDANDEIKTINDNWKTLQVFLDHLTIREQQAEENGVKDVIGNIDEELKKYLEKRKVVTKEEDKSETQEEKSDESSSSDQSSTDTSTSDRDSSSSDESVKKKKSKKYLKKRKINATSDKKRIKKPRKDIDSDENNILTKLIMKMDNRKIPELEKFDEDMNMELCEYLDMFEEHYSENFRGGKHFWLNELKKYLSGSLLESYTSIRQTENKYGKVKIKLIQWYEDEKESRKKKSKRKYENVQMRAGESLLMYSNRLLSLFKKAYPRKSHETSNKLIDKFQQTVPRNVKHKLENQILHYKLHNKRLTFKKLQKFAGILDLNSNPVSDEESDNRDIVKINLSRPDYVKKSWQNNNNWENKRPVYTTNNFNVSGKIPSVGNENNYKTCDYCKRFGHTYEKCRKRLRLCFKCGKPGHFSTNCWFNKNQNEQRSNVRQQSVSPRKGKIVYHNQRSRSHQVYNRNETQVGKQDLNSQPPVQSRESWRK